MKIFKLVPPKITNLGPKIPLLLKLMRGQKQAGLRGFPESIARQSGDIRRER
jgi:hypothetical protein